MVLKTQVLLLVAQRNELKPVPGAELRLPACPPTRAQAVLCARGLPA